MVKGVLYSTAGTRRAVVALDAATGEMLWMHSERRRRARRGRAAPAVGPRPVLLDRRRARSGSSTSRPATGWSRSTPRPAQPVASFGTQRHRRSEAGRRSGASISVNGEVGLHADAGRRRQRRHRRRRASSRRQCRKSKANVKGYVRGFDVRTGKRLWIFHTIPQPGRVRQRHLAERLVGLHRQHRRVGADLGRRGARPRLPAGRAADRRLLRRPSARATTCSARAWSRSTCRPASASGTTSSCTTACGTSTSRARRSSSTSPSTAARSRRWRSRPSRPSSTCSTAMTGEPVWPIEERPVAKGDVPGEWYSPTQPFPTKPPAYDRQGLSDDDLIDFTPELRAEARSCVARYQHRPDLHAAGREPDGGTARHADAGRARRRRPTGRAAPTIPRRTSVYVSSRNVDRGRSAWCRRRPARPTCPITRAPC